jgi:hypothetical protein
MKLGDIHCRDFARLVQFLMLSKCCYTCVECSCNLQGLICNLQAVSQYLVKEFTQVLHINSHFMLLDLATMNYRNQKLKIVPTTFISDVH